MGRSSIPRPTNVMKRCPLSSPPLEADVRERQHVAAAHAGRAGTEAIELAAGVRRADERADGRTADEIGPNAGSFQRAHDADMGPAAGSAAAQYETEPVARASCGPTNGSWAGLAARKSTPRTVLVTFLISCKLQYRVNGGGRAELPSALHL